MFAPRIFTVVIAMVIGVRLYEITPDAFCGSPSDVESAPARLVPWGDSDDATASPAPDSTPDHIRASPGHVDDGSRGSSATCRVEGIPAPVPDRATMKEQAP